jgi:hypothetical protein
MLAALFFLLGSLVVLSYSLCLVIALIVIMGLIIQEIILPIVHEVLEQISKLIEKKQ